MQQPPNQEGWPQQQWPPQQQPWLPQQPNTGYLPQQPSWSPQPLPPQQGMYGYPMQSPPIQQPQMPPPKKRRGGLWIAIGAFVVASVLCGFLGHSASSQSNSNTSAAVSTSASNNSDATVVPTSAQDTPTPTPTPTRAPQWTTTQTFSGNGIKKTAIFQVGDDWKINWSCNPSSFYGSEYNVQVYVYGTDNTPLDVAVNAICKAGSTADSTEEHQGGNIYLEINSEGSWNIQVQELK